MINILVFCHVMKSEQLIWRPGTRRWNLRVPSLQMSCSDLRGCQDGSASNGGQGDMPYCLAMMTSSNGNIFRVTGPLCGEFTGHPTQRPVTRIFDVFFDLWLNKRLSNTREAGDLRRHHAHYDVTIMLWWPYATEHASPLCEQESNISDNWWPMAAEIKMKNGVNDDAKTKQIYSVRRYNWLCPDPGPLLLTLIKLNPSMDKW